MARELHDLMREAAAADEAVLARIATDGPLAVARTAVRRRRRVRHARHAVVGVAAVAALGTAAVLGGGAFRQPVLPAESPTPTPTTDAMPSPTPEPSEAPTAALVVEPDMPPYRPLTAEVLATTGPGWVLTTFDHPERSTFRVFVVSPTGEAYRAADVHLGDSPGEHESTFWVAHWDAPSERAVVVLAHGDDSSRAQLDLLTGEVTPDDRGLPQSMSLAGFSADGSEVWGSVYGTEGTWLLPSGGDARRVSVGAASGAVDPSGRYVALLTGDGTTVLDLTTGTAGPVLVTEHVDEGCAASGWSDPGMLLVLCPWGPDGGAVDSIAVIDVTGSVPDEVSVHVYGADEPRPLLSLVRVAGGVLAGPATTPGDASTDCDDNTVATFDASGRATTMLPVRTDVSGWLASDDGVVYAGIASQCDGVAASPRLTAVDATTGDVTVLVPAPSSGDRWFFSWRVAH